MNKDPSGERKSEPSSRKVYQAEVTASAKALRCGLYRSCSALQILAILPTQTQRRQREGKGCFFPEGQREAHTTVDA